MSALGDGGEVAHPHGRAHFGVSSRANETELIRLMDSSGTTCDLSDDIKEDDKSPTDPKVPEMCAQVRKRSQFELD